MTPKFLSLSLSIALSLSLFLSLPSFSFFAYGNRLLALFLSLLSFASFLSLDPLTSSRVLSITALGREACSRLSELRSSVLLQCMPGHLGVGEGPVRDRSSSRGSPLPERVLRAVHRSGRSVVEDIRVPFPLKPSHLAVRASCRADGRLLGCLCASVIVAWRRGILCPVSLSLSLSVCLSLSLSLLIPLLLSVSKLT